MSARVLVSGASGFVGSAVVRALLRHGYTVRALTRPAGDTANLDGLDVETARGDLLDPQSLEHALEGCEGLFHAAADYRLWARDPREIRTANVRGTHNILLAARRQGVRRIVHTSSVATLGLNADGTPANEETPARLGDMIGAYKRSKYLSEALARRCARMGSDIVIVNPAAPVGPRDRKPTPTGRMILDAARGKMPAYVDTGLCVVHVDDVAEGHVLAYERGQRGRRYVLGGENMGLREILQTVAGLTGRHGPWLKLPHAAVLPVAHAAEAWAR
ncbi:MAG: NAD-dependent epimerase/dehydratase family protein, partial [Rhodanobacteraceae bacterium]